MPDINQWASNFSEDQISSTDINGDSLQIIPNDADPGVSEPDAHSSLALAGQQSVKASGSGDIIKGKVIGIVDGDTFDLLDDNNTTIRIRMEGIDAPEKGMPFYQVAKKHLSSLCFSQRVTVQITRAESGNRKIGFTYLADGTELSHEMIRSGLAWHFKRYNNDADLAALEQDAREARRSLWKDPNPLPPWEIRKIRRGGESTKELFNITDDQR